MRAFKVRLALYSIHVDSGEPQYVKAGRATDRKGIERQARAMGLRFVREPGSLFGGYYVGRNGQAYKVDICATGP